MCGIAAVAFSDPSSTASAVERMVGQLGHRGPDANGYRHLPGCHLGHSRLSIIDLCSGAQPMSDHSGRYCITFNGEIYNYRELREMLAAKGRQFNTHSDTEVIMAAYAEWGAGCVDRFRGMFAFAIWDLVDQRLFAARDLFGEKPLYYATAASGSLVLASELKALVNLGLVTPKIDAEAVDGFLAFGYVPPDRTIYANIHTLPPGHYLEWDGKNVRLTRYWKCHAAKTQLSLDDSAARLRELLTQAVRRQMVADVPVGAFLSGGLDSSTIVALMQQQSSRPVKTFSVGFGNYINELPYARAVAEKYKTEHYEIDLGMPPVAELLETMVGVYDEPFADTSHIPTYLISEFASRHVKVVLSGDGGDELFGGYGWYPPLAQSEKLSSSHLTWVLLRFISKLYQDRKRDLYLKSCAAGLAARWPDDMWTRHVMSQMYFSPSERAALWQGKGEGKAFKPNGYFRSTNGETGLDQAFYFDLNSYLPGDILVKVDRAAMAHGLETRAPFLDRDVVEFALSLPSALKVDGENTKVLLKRAASCYWPEELRNRNKQGFGAPVNAWLSDSGVEALSQRVFGARSALRELLPGLPPARQLKRTYQTWILLTLGLWIERHGILG